MRAPYKAQTEWVRAICVTEMVSQKATQVKTSENHYLQLLSVTLLPRGFQVALLEKEEYSDF